MTTARCIALASLITLSAGVGSAQDAARPAAKAELLARPPFDRITLLDDSTWEIEPLSPRPLPPIDPKRRARARKASDPPPSQGNIGVGAEKSTVDAKAAKDEEDGEPPLVIHMLEGDVRDFRVKHEHIKAVTYFEDLLIAEALRLLGAGDHAKAFEHLLAVRARQPRWRGLEDAVDRVLFEEGSRALIDQDGERGLRLLGELFARKPSYPGLGDKLAGSFGARIARAFDLGAYAKGRQELHELKQVVADHRIVRESIARFEGRAREIFGRAGRAKGAERLDLILRAAEVWPDLPGLDSAYREAFAATPTLDVGVADLPRPIGPWLRSSASARSAPLIYRPLLASAGEDAIKGTPPEQLAASVETFDLSKGIRIRLKPGAAWSDGSRPVAAIDVARSLADRAIPTLPGYSARWADLLERVEVTEDDTVEIRLTRASLRPESWLVAPVGPAHAGADGWVSTVGRGRRPEGDGPYRWASSRDGVDDYVAARDGLKVRRVREVRYGSPSAALAAIVRGEVSLIEAVPPDRVKDLAAVDGVRVGRYATPALHRIALDGRTEALRNRSLRRALSLAVDRKSLLEETVLGRPADAENATADGPFLKGSFADAPDVPPLDHNPLLARMLVAAAKKELGGLPIRLTLEHPPTSAARAVCPKLAEAWGLVDVQVVVKEVSEAELDARLRAGGRFDLAYRESRPGAPASDAGPTIVPGFDAPASSDPLASVASPRILQLLLQVDRAPETTTAQVLLLQVDRECRDELPILPLWQVVDHFAYRTRVKGIADEITSLYRGIESWEVEAWYPNDSW